MERYLPIEVIHRPKSGFGGPVRKWVNEELTSCVEDELSEINLKKYGVFSVQEVHKLINETRKGKLDAAYTVLAIVSIHSFLKQFIVKV